MTTTAPAPEEAEPAPPSRSRRRGRLALVLATTVGVLVALLVVVLATSPPATDRIAKSPLVGQAAPPIEGETVNGTAFDLGRYQGEWVLVNFFATWCGPCRVEHPELRRFSEDHQRIGDAAVVSVVVYDTAENVADFFAEEGGDWPVVIDPDSKTDLSYGLVKVPESYLVAPSGIVAAQITGGVTAEGRDAVIAQVEAGR